MNVLLNSRLARWAAYIAAAVIGWFVSKDIVPPQDAAKATGDLTTLFQALGAAGLAIVVFIAQLFVRKITSGGAGGTTGKNGTGTSGGNVPCLLAAAVLSMAGFALLPSCTAVGSAITGQPVAGTAVQRAGHADATPILIASGDLAQAETEAEAATKAGTKPAVHGLYDAGRAATAIREVFTESGK